MCKFNRTIEGSTLTLRETKLILVDKLTPKGKTTKEIKEAENHANAFNYMLKQVANIDSEFILKLHSTLMNNIEDDHGQYRKENVEIIGSLSKPPNFEEVDYELKVFFDWSKKAKILHPFELAVLTHLKFVTIHPFTDGNGRISRLLMNFVLKRNNLPMFDIPYENREQYYISLEESQTKKDSKSFAKYCLKEYKKQYSN